MTQLPVEAVGNGYMQLNWAGLALPYSPWSMSISNGITNSTIGVNTNTFVTLTGTPGSIYSLYLYGSGNPGLIAGSAVIRMPLYNLYVGPIDESTIGMLWSSVSTGPVDLYMSENLVASGIYPPYYFTGLPGKTYSVVITDVGDPSQSSSTIFVQTTPVSIIYGMITGSTYSILIQDANTGPWSINLNGVNVGSTSSNYYIGSITESTLNSLVVYNTYNQICTTHLFYSSFDVYISKLTPYALYINWTNPNATFTIFVDAISTYSTNETNFIVPLIPGTSYKIYVQDSQAVSSNPMFITAPLPSSLSFGINTFFSPVLV